MSLPTSPWVKPGPSTQLVALIFMTFDYRYSSVTQMLDWDPVPFGGFLSHPGDYWHGFSSKVFNEKIQWRAVVPAQLPQSS